MRKIHARILMTIALLAVGCGDSGSSSDGGTGDGAANATARAAIKNSFQNAPFTLIKVVYKGVTFNGPIAKGGESSAQAVTPGADRAYATAAFNYDPAGGPPKEVLVMRTKEPVEAAEGKTISVVFSEPSHFGKCGGMTKDEYEKIAKDYFPGDPVQAYDSIKCAP
ncbi:MAG: hypothetical protein GMKNLPBB_01268 [Myxococcota bacterium]|nr:hypothetical protein [Myxococcota bacterium]